MEININEKDLSTQEKAKTEGSRLPFAYVRAKREKGFGAPQGEGKKKAQLLIKAAGVALGELKSETEPIISDNSMRIVF